MEIRTKAVNDVTLLKIEGRLDGDTAPEMQDRLIQTAAGRPSKIIVNLADVEYVSSAGLRAILIAAKAVAAADGELRICNLHGMVRDVFDISGFSKALAVFPSEADALDGF